MGWSQTKVTTRQRQCITARQTSQQGETDAFEDLSEQMAVAFCAHFVEDNARQVQRRVVIPESPDQRSQ